MLYRGWEQEEPHPRGLHILRTYVITTQASNKEGAHAQDSRAGSFPSSKDLAVLHTPEWDWEPLDQWAMGA